MNIIEGDYRRLLSLILIMMGVALIVGVTALGVFYDAALQREQQRLASFAAGQARLMSGLASVDVPDILEEQRRLREQGAGQTAELQVARRDGALMVFLTPARGTETVTAPIPLGDARAEPMSAALSGRSGTMIGRDYAGRWVVAAFQPLPALGLGLVAKIDLAEIHARYRRAGAITGAVALVVVIGAALLFFRLSDPVIRRMRETEGRYRALFENMSLGAAVFRPAADGEDFVFVDLNLAGEKIARVRRQDVIGWSVQQTFPGVRNAGFLDQMTRVWRTGQAEYLPARYYADDRLQGWRDTHAYKLPSGQLVCLFADVSERIEALEALRLSEARYRTAGEAIRYGVWICNPDGGIEFVSQSFLDLIGKTLAEVTPRGWLDCLPPEEARRTRLAWKDCVRSGADWSWEHRVRGTDGAFRTILSIGRPVRDASERITSWVGFNLDISQRKRAEEALNESEARLRRTLDSAPFPIMVHADDGEVVHLSRAWLDITGYRRDELRTIAAWIERAYGEGGDAVHRGIDQLYALDRAVDEGEFRIRAANGGTRVWNFHSAPLGLDGQGRRLVVSMAADVTERRNAERALKESEHRIRALLDASQDEILLLSTDGMVLAINKAAERRLARKTGNASPVGAHLDRLLSADQVEQRMALVRQVAATARLAHWEVPIRTRWFEFWFYPVIQPDRPVTEVAVYAREVTEQKRSQAELSKLFEAVRQSPMSVVITDRNGTIEYVNPEFTQVTGYTAAEAVGQNPRILKSGHNTPDYEELWRTISAGGVWRGEFLNKKKNGELFWELASIAPVKDGDEITNFVAVKEDITERREIEEQLRQSQKMQAVGQLTGGIAHDFNNLLAIISGNLQLLRERFGTDAKAQEFLDDALWSARRGAELTHRLLAFARKQPLKPAVIDLNEVVRSMTELLRRTLGATIRIEESLVGELWKAIADRGELERALINLAVNSRDAMSHAGTLTLETRNALLDQDYAEQYEEVAAGDYVLLAVTDDGAGMPPEVVQRVFEPFFTTKEVGQGSGLGLSMVYGFVKQSGGHISIYSRVGQGTSVKLYLPRAPSLTGASQPVPQEFTLPASSDKVVLVVEDETRLRKIAVKMLERLGLRSVQAETASDALGLLGRTRVDVLFTDIELPGGMSGTELADAAKSIDPGIKVLFTTGYARETMLQERCRQGRAPWLLKPYSHQDLGRELKALLFPVVH